MSTDLRGLLRDLADSVPYTGEDIALADRSYIAGRRRRRLRHLVVSSAAAVVVLIAMFAGLFLGSAPLAARYGSSGGATVHSYPQHIGRQWPVLDLPARPGPLAALLPVNGGWEAMSSNGHRWRVPYLHTLNPGLSPDGRLLGYLKGGDSGPFVIRDLVTGRTVSNAAVGFSTGAGGSKYQIYSEEPIRFSADDLYLAFQGLVDAVNAVVVLDVTQARVVAAIRGGGSLAGWSGEDLVLVSDGHISVRSHDHGFTTSTTAPAPGLAAAGNPLQVSTDGRQLGVLTGGEAAERLTLFDVATGQKISSTAVPAKPDNASYALGVGGTTTYPHLRQLSDHIDLVRVSSTGAARIIGIEPDVDQAYVVLAADAFDGSAQSSLALDRAGSWLAAGYGWLIGLVAALLGIAAARRRLRGAVPPWSLRRRRILVLGVVAGTCVVTAVLTPYVLVPAMTGNLVSTQAIWWSPSDEAAARSGGIDGDPASLVVERPGQEQGFAVLIHNPTSQDQRVSRPGDSQKTLAGEVFSVATAAGTAAQARTLTYRPSAVIPAHQSRWMHVGRAIDPCVEGASTKNGTGSLPSLTIGVRIGWLSRDELIGVAPARSWLGACP